MITSAKTATEEAILREERYGAHNYHPLPVVLSKGEGVYLWDVEGKRYFDFLSAYSAVNHGHCHPVVIQALVKQAKELTLVSRAFHSDQLGMAEERICSLFDYDKAIFMNTGVEAVETAIKLARRWGYDKKKIPDNQATIVVARNNFHGRTTGVISFSTSPETKDRFGPYLDGFTVVPYNDLDALEQVFNANPNICAFLVEPIQGEAGVLVPDEGYLQKVKALCEAYRVLLIVDEIQTGMGRTGKLLASDYDEVKADLLVVGKALAGGVMPVSAVLTSDQVMLGIKPGEHGSTFGGNPLAAAVTIAAIDVLEEEAMVDNAFYMGIFFRQAMEQLQQRRPDLVKAVRGKGLMNAIDIVPNDNGRKAWDICLALKEKGLLAKPTQDHTIRFSPPLVISHQQLLTACKIIEEVILHF